MSSELLRNHLITAYRAGVAAADPARAVQDALNRRGPELESASRIIVLGLGKAAGRMAEAALPFLQGREYSGTIVTTESEAKALEGLNVIPGEHPVPGFKSLAAGQGLLATASEAREGDLVLALISGGGSSLAVAPSDGVSLSDKVAISEHLLRCGANIKEMNSIRRCLSKIKGGQLAAMASPAYIVSLMISDVPDDNPEFIASGPTVAPREYQPLKPILERYKFGDDMLQTIMRCEANQAMKEISAGDIEISASNAISKAAAVASLKQSGFAVEQVEGWLDLDVGSAASQLLSLLHDAASFGRPVALVSGGEPSVRVTGGGMGGRNQELALRFALQESTRKLPRPWTFLSCGTDGRDGPTDAAGAVVDGATIPAIEAKGFSVGTELANNNSYAPLEAAGALLKTGSTGTNVADIQIGIMT